MTCPTAGLGQRSPIVGVHAVDLLAFAGIPLTSGSGQQRWCLGRRFRRRCRWHNRRRDSATPPTSTCGVAIVVTFFSPKNVAAPGVLKAPPLRYAIGSSWLGIALPTWPTRSPS